MLEVRTRVLKKGLKTKGQVVYWMSRDQRVQDNWAFIAAYQKANITSNHLEVVFTLTKSYPNANDRSYAFLINGLKEVESYLRELNIPFRILLGEPVQSLEAYVNTNKVAFLYTDFDPLRIKWKWKEVLLPKLDISVFEVDAHNIVPCWQASSKQEYSAKTFRDKISKLLPGYLNDFPELEPLKQHLNVVTTDWEFYQKELNLDNSSFLLKPIIPGQREVMKKFNYFISHLLKDYEKNRNNPNINALSGLSPYLHFGHISAQRIAIEIQKKYVGDPNANAFLEELIVRRELSDNFCFYNNNYDNLSGAPNWALNTLNKHRNDEREWHYELKTFENAQTHDELWNAAQLEMTKTGKMHGYLRMYWAKKLLEWTPSPEIALKYAIYLNDIYSLDGRDPNGYVGCLWAIAGLHDRPWKERPVYGMIRYMNDKGCARKFDVKKYIKSINDLI